MFYIIQHTEPWMAGSALRDRNWFSVVAIAHTREQAEEMLEAKQALPGSIRYSLAEAV